MFDFREFSTRMELEGSTTLCFQSRRYPGHAYRVRVCVCVCVYMCVYVGVCMCVCLCIVCNSSLSLSQVDRSRRKLPLPPPEDGEDQGLLSVVAMYDFTAKEDTDLTLKQVHTCTHRYHKVTEYIYHLLY